MAFPAADTIYLGSIKMPGVWHLQPGQKEFGWAVQQGWGLTGATVRPVGDPLATATFLVKFFDETSWDLFQPLREKFLSRAAVTLAGGLNYAIGIYHPELSKLGITQVVPKKAPWFTNTGLGLWVGQVEFLQYRKAKPALETPQVAIPSIALPQPSAVDVFKQELALHNSQLTGSR